MTDLISPAGAPSDRGGGGPTGPARYFAVIDRLSSRIETAAMAISALAIVAITVIVCVEVVLRSVFGISTLVSAEYAGYLLAAHVYLGLAWTFRDGGFIRVDLVPGVLQGRAAAVFDFAMAVIACLIFCFYTWYLIGFVIQTYRAGTMSVFVTRTPLWLPQIVLPIGSILMTWALFLTAVRAAFEISDPRSYPSAAGESGSTEAGIL